MHKIKLHPILLVAAALYIFSGEWALFAAGFSAVVIHELSHFAAARSRGYALFELNLLPLGAILSTGESILPSDEALIYSAGPFSNLMLCVFLVASWWLFPSAYPYTSDFFKANLAVGAFNLVPAYPLDGAKLLLSAAKNKRRMIRFQKTLGVLLSAALTALFFVSAFSEINYTLGTAAVTLFFGSVFELKKQSYIHICRQLSFVKELSAPLEKKRLVIGENISLKRVLRVLKPHFLYEFELVDAALRRKAVFDEARLLELISDAGASEKVGAAYEACVRSLKTGANL